MGTFTCLKFTGQLKEPFVKDVEERLTTKAHEKWWEEHRNDEDYLGVWGELAKKYPFISKSKFVSLTRCDAIPFGAFSHYNIGKAGREEIINQVGFSNIEEVYDQCTWIFQCDLKNYEREIETFIQEIATVMCSKFIAEVWHEEDPFPRVYIYNNDILEIVL